MSKDPKVQILQNFKFCSRRLIDLITEKDLKLDCLNILKLSFSKQNTKKKIEFDIKTRL